MKLLYKGVVASKKNSKQIIRNPRTGKPMIISSKQARESAADMVAQFVKQLPEDLFTYVMLHDGHERKELAREEKEKYAVGIELYQPDHRRRDLDNQATAILDALVEAGALPDDCIEFVEKLTISLGGYDKENPRAIINIERL